MKHGGTRPLVIAHRGDSRNAPENTLSALQAAMDAGADGVEFDVRLARDGVPVVIHDATLKRTAGRSVSVGSLTSAELINVDVGSWFNARHPGRARAQFADERVPTLVQTLRLLRPFAGSIYIELKCGRANHPELVHAVSDVLRSSPLLPRIIIKSFRLAAVSEVRRCLPQVQTAALFEPSILHVLRRRRYIIERAKRCGAHQLSLHRSLVTPMLAELACRANMPLTVWTVDSTKWIDRAHKLGIRALITNDVGKMLRAETLM